MQTLHLAGTELSPVGGVIDTIGWRRAATGRQANPPAGWRPIGRRATLIQPSGALLMATYSPESGVVRVSSLDGVVRLAADVLNPGRERPVVCVTLPTWASQPLVDPDALAAVTGGAAQIYVLPTGDLSWELTDRLPPRLDVYGGAVRVWWPFREPDPDPFEHPLFLIHDRIESDATISRIVDMLERRGFLDREVLDEGAEVPAVVTRVLPHGAELTLAGGEVAFAHASHLTSIRWLEAPQVVRAGQPVRVRVGAPADPGRRRPVSLLPFEPDPWERLLEQYQEGMLVEGVVTELRNTGALVEVFPGIRGLLHKSQITREWVSHPEDYLAAEEVIVVRIMRIDAAVERIELTCLDFDGREPVESVAALLPDGPPWLPEEAAAAEADLDEETVEDAEAESMVPEAVNSPELAAAADSLETMEGHADETPAAAGFPDHAGETEQLEQVIADGRELQAQLGELFDGAQRRLRQLRAEAGQVRQVLERDLAQARLRLLEFAESETGQLVGSTEAALEAARKEADELRQRLTAAEDDRRELLERLKEARTATKEAERRTERYRKDLRQERDRTASLEHELREAGGDEEVRFVRDLRLAWEHSTTLADRDRYRWCEPALGRDFLASVETVQGISRDRIVEVCAHVVCGRAPAIAGLELHPLRSSEGGDAPQRQRADGAKAWRCSLQSGTPSARRLHYWALPDGRIELAKVVYHDDYSIR